jgi:hypothetical protein
VPLRGVDNKTDILLDAQHGFGQAGRLMPLSGWGESVAYSVI